MSWVAIVIIAKIVILYLLFISVMEGFKLTYMQKLRTILAHVTVRVGDVPWGIIHPQAWAAELEKIEGVRGVTISIP